MNPEHLLAGTASLFLALGDKTRLRLLNLMRDREICVSSFTGVLEQSQPLISRHLAYLRNSGIVEARRDGKWMHYGISTQLDENTGRLLHELFNWMESQDGLRVDREKYFAMAGVETEVVGEPVPQKQPRRSRRQVAAATMDVEEIEPDLEVSVTALESDDYDRHSFDSHADEYDDRVRHNELEDFLL